MPITKLDATGVDFSAGTPALGSISPANITGNVLMPSGSRITASDAGSFVAPGMVVQTVYATNGFSRQYIASTSPVAVTGLAATITPKFNNSVIQVSGMVTSSYTHVTSLAIYRNGSTVIPNHGGNSNSGSGPISLWTSYNQGVGAGTSSVDPLPVLFFDQHNLGGTALTYQIYMNAGWGGTTYGLYINDRDSNDMLGTSYIMLQEITR